MACPLPSPDLTVINPPCDFTFRNLKPLRPGVCARGPKTSAVDFPNVSQIPPLFYRTLSFLELTSSFNAGTEGKFQPPYCSH